MTTTLTPTGVTTEQATALWGQLRQHLINAERVLEEIVEKRAWEPMGYSSFAEAWTGQHMSDITLAAEVRPHVVYAMFDGGLTIDQVASEVKGIGRDRAESLARQKRNGVPARDASLSVVREHLREKPSRASAIHLEVGVTRLERYKCIAKHLGLSVEDIAKDAIEDKFKELS